MMVDKETSLMHYGILGMKWGIRRYQNKDGTWTKEGKEHRAEGNSKTTPAEPPNKETETPGKTADQTVQDVSEKLLTEREMMDTDSQRSINAAKTGLSCIKAARPWDGDDFDPESKMDREWFLIEDQTYGLPQIADLANQGYNEKEINKMLSDGLDAYEKSKYAEGFNGDKGVDVSGLWYLSMSGYGDGWNADNISDYIRECTNYVKNETHHSDASSEEDSLMHYGILGMKWGIRRFQKKDGSLTPEGRERYGDDTPDGNKSSSGTSDITPRTPAKSASEMTDQELNQALNRLRMEQQYNELTGAKSSNQYQNQQNFSTPPSNTGNLSNAELQAYITRLDMEKRYKQLIAPPPKELTLGQKFVKEVLPAVVLEVGKELAKGSLKKALGLEKSNNGSDNDGSGKKNNSNNNNDGGGKQKNYDKQFSETNSRIDKLTNAISVLANNQKKSGDNQNSQNNQKKSGDDQSEQKKSGSKQNKQNFRYTIKNDNAPWVDLSTPNDDGSIPFVGKDLERLRKAGFSDRFIRKNWYAAHNTILDEIDEGRREIERMLGS